MPETARRIPPCRAASSFLHVAEAFQRRSATRQIFGKRMWAALLRGSFYGTKLGDSNRLSRYNVSCWRWRPEQIGSVVVANPAGDSSASPRDFKLAGLALHHRDTRIAFPFASCTMANFARGFCVLLLSAATFATDSVLAVTAALPSAIAWS